jgi:hypothetical protein
MNKHSVFLHMARASQGVSFILELLLLATRPWWLDLLQPFVQTQKSHLPKKMAHCLSAVHRLSKYPSLDARDKTL